MVIGSNTVEKETMSSRDNRLFRRCPFQNESFISLFYQKELKFTISAAT
jgi:hypothetical protein